MTSSSGTNRCVADASTKRRKQRRHLDPGEVLLAGLRVAHEHGEVERQPGDVGERVRRVDRQRRQHREDLLREQPRAAARCSSSVELVPAHAARCPPRPAPGATSSRKTAACRCISSCGAPPDLLEHLARHQAGGGADGDAGGDAPLEAGHPDHEELVEVAGEDRQELGPLEQRQLGVLGQLEHPLVEGEPGQLAVEEPVVGQRLLDARQDGGGVVGRGSYLRDLGVLAHAHRLRIARPGGSRSAFNTCMPVGGRACRDHASPPVGGRACRDPGRRSSLSRPVRSRTAPPPEAPAPLVVSTSSTTGLGPSAARPVGPVEAPDAGRACRDPSPHAGRACRDPSPHAGRACRDPPPHAVRASPGSGRSASP